MDVKTKSLTRIPKLMEEAIESIVGTRIFWMISEEYDNLKIEYENSCKKKMTYEKIEDEM